MLQHIRKVTQCQYDLSLQVTTQHYAPIQPSKYIPYTIPHKTFSTALQKP